MTPLPLAALTLCCLHSLLRLTGAEIHCAKPKLCLSTKRTLKKGGIHRFFFFVLVIPPYKTLNLLLRFL